jgi:hypothetical protein
MWYRSNAFERDRLKLNGVLRSCYSGRGRGRILIILLVVSIA